MHFSAITYNIHKGIGNDRLYRLNRTIEVLKSTEADFMLLQEVDQFVPRSKKEDTAQVIAEALGMHYSLGLNVKLMKGAYGNATLSRYPILESKNLDLTWGIKKRRGCLFTKIATPKGNLNIFNFHLGLAGMERSWQIKKLLRIIKEHNHENPILISGDSNDRNHKLNKIFAEAGYKDSFQEKKMFTYPSYAPIWRLDKTFVSESVHIQEHAVINNKLTRMTSDHLPIKVVFKL